MPTILQQHVLVSGYDIVGLYLFLDKNSEQLDTRLAMLRKNLESKIYESLSIDEFENLEEFYQRQIEIQPKKDY